MNWNKSVNDLDDFASKIVSGSKSVKKVTNLMDWFQRPVFKAQNINSQDSLDTKAVTLELCSLYLKIGEYKIL